MDRAGNTEALHTVSFGIDKSSPTIGHIQSPPANGEGWNSTAVTVTFSCADSVSGVVSCTAPQTVSTEGRAQVVTGTVTDNAGNSATDPASVSIDRTPPTMVVDAIPSPNSRGWYAAPVTVTFTAGDALSGVKTADRSRTFGEGADQTATGSAIDAAGNSTSVTTPKISVDTTAPSIHGTVLGNPTGGWYSGDVTVGWACDDVLSGIVACPADSVVGGEGSDLSASATVSDKADNSATGNVSGIRIDRTPPVSSATGVPGGWVNAPVTVGLASTDNLSDVAATFYAVDGGDPVAGTSVTVGAQGTHTVRYWSVDRAGNAEAAHTFTVRLDLTSPSITPASSPAPNTNGWNNSDVSVSFSCLDQVNLSGLADCTEPSTVTTEGRAQQVTGHATDNAGNRVTGTAVLNIDKTAPTVTGAPDRAANAAGWYDDDVTVSFVGEDALSGIDTVTGPQHLGEGADQSVTGTATDNAGNGATTTVAGVNVDKTAPDLSAAPTALPNDNGWYNAPVTQVWLASDALSGLAGETPAHAVLDTEGRGQTVSAQVSDKAGHTTSATSAPVDIDLTDPMTDADAPGSWTKQGVEVTLHPHDALSGVASTHYSVDGGAVQEGTHVTLAEEGTHTVTYASTDLAGNTESERSVTVRIDKSAPSISHALTPPANGNGWNNTDVTVTFTCEDQDGLSGIASCTAPDGHRRDRRRAGHRNGHGQRWQQRQRHRHREPRPHQARDRRQPHPGRQRARVEQHRRHRPLRRHGRPLEHRRGDPGPDVRRGHGPVAAGLRPRRGREHRHRDRRRHQRRRDRAEPARGGDHCRRRGRLVPRRRHHQLDRDRRPLRRPWRPLPTAPSSARVAASGRPPRSLTRPATAPPRTASGSASTARRRPPALSRRPAGATRRSPSASTARTGSPGWTRRTTRSTVGRPTRARPSPSPARACTPSATGAWTSPATSSRRTTVQVKIDLTAPGVTHTLTPAPNAAGWNDGPVTVAFSCTDALSGVADCAPSSRCRPTARTRSPPAPAPTARATRTPTSRR